MPNNFDSIWRRDEKEALIVRKAKFADLSTWSIIFPLISDKLYMTNEAKKDDNIIELEFNNRLDCPVIKEAVEPAPTPVVDLKESTMFKRGCAFAIDISTIVLIKTFFTGSFSAFIQAFLPQLQGSTQLNILKDFAGLDSLLTTFIFFGYFIFSFYSLHGKTFGKKLMKLNVVDTKFINDKSHKYHDPDLFQSMKRTAGYAVCYASFGILFAVSFFRKDRKGLQDMFAGTVVLSDDKLAEVIANRDIKVPTPLPRPEQLDLIQAA